jgi:hypothetical protein
VSVYRLMAGVGACFDDLDRTRAGRQGTPAPWHRLGLLPDLSDVQVQMVGASGRDATHMARVRQFWLAYFAATGAQVQAYGRTVGSLGR